MNTQLTIVSGSIADVAGRTGTSLAESFMNADAIVICDVSGSMGSSDSREGKTRYDVELEELAKLQASMPGKIAVVAFSDTAMFVPGGAPPFMSARTNLAGALRFAQVADVAEMRFICISDGNPDNPEEALKVAGQFKGKIDTVFVGPENDYDGGRKFLEKLARANKGQAVTADRAVQLASTIETLLLA